MKPNRTGPKRNRNAHAGKGQRVKSSPPQQCALCSPWKTIATRSSRGNDIWGKYVALQPEETMSKKKNRHEVTDLIKGEKYTEQGDGNTAGGEGAPWEAQDTEVGFCCFFDVNQELKRVLPFIKAPLQWTQNPDTWRSTPSPAARQWEALRQTATPCHMGHQDALPQTTGRKGGGWGWWIEASKKELDYQSLAFRPWAGVFIVFHNYVLNTYCLWCGTELRGKSWRLSTSNVYKQDNNTNKTSNRVLLTFVQVPSSSSPYVHVTWQGYNHSKYTILHPTFKNQVVLYKFFHTAPQVSKF